MSEMSDPIPLSAPDGTVYAWACGECRRVYGAKDGCDATGIRYGMPHLSAERCCMKCPCGAGMYGHGPLCFECRAKARRAFEVLGAVGAAVAVREYGIAAFDRVAAFAEPLAALCGVDVETVRGWSG